MRKTQTGKARAVTVCVGDGALGEVICVRDRVVGIKARAALAKELKRVRTEERSAHTADIDAVVVAFVSKSQKLETCLIACADFL